MRILLLLLCGLPLLAQDYQLPLWPDGVPNQLDTSQEEQREQRDILWITKVQDPDIRIYLPAKQAIRLVRQHATSWNIDPAKVGVMGFSAGGHLASTLGTQYDDAESNVANRLAATSAR